MFLGWMANGGLITPQPFNSIFTSSNPEISLFTKYPSPITPITATIAR